MLLKDIGEFGLIEKIKAIVDQPGRLLLKGIDDDAAVYETDADAYQLVSTDAFVEDVHFKLDYFTFYQLGWRVTAANLSDIAAMGGAPQYLLYSIAVPKRLPVESILEFYQGAKALAKQHGVIIIGGDTTASPERLFVSVTVIGSVAKSKLALRSGAKIGDGIFVTGYPGCSAAGLQVLTQNMDKKNFKFAVQKHLQPQPRVAEAPFLVESFPVHAMIDISDGVASEIHHICKQSKTGASIYQNQLPIGQELTRIAQLSNSNPMDFVLFGGEDFELLFTAPATFADEIKKSLLKKFKLPCFNLGEITEPDKGILLANLKDELQPLPAKGFDHFK